MYIPAGKLKSIDISSVFIVTENTSSAVIVAYRLGKMVFFTASITPIEMSEFRNKSFLSIPAGYRPAAAIGLAGSVYISITNANTEVKASPLTAYPAGSLTKNLTRRKFYG